MTELHLDRLSREGSGHTLYCFAGPVTDRCDGACPRAPTGWQLPSALAELVESLIEANVLERVGKYFWLKGSPL